jgi:hypothetical protein
MQGLRAEVGDRPDPPRCFMPRRPAALCALLLSLAVASSAAALDSDGDEIEDDVDNCTAIANPTQLDVDDDSYGNACDCDHNQDEVCGRPDVSILFACFGRTTGPGVGPPDDPTCEKSDQNGDGTVGLQDLNLLLNRYGLAPGPAAAKAAVCDAAHELLCPGLDVVAADVALADCLLRTDARTDPQSFQTATVLRSITRVARPAFETGPGPDPAKLDSVSELLDALGFGADGRNPLAWMATPPLSAERTCLVPDDAVFERDAEELLRKQVVPQINAALRALRPIPASWSDFCAIERMDMTLEMEIDHSDVLLARASLLALRGMIRLLGAYELDFDLADGCRAFYEQGFGGVERLLSEYPELLRPDPARATTLAGMAGADLREALRVLVAAIDSMKAETDDQLDDFFSLDPASFTPEEETELRQLLAAIDASFDAPTPIPDAGLCGDPPLDAARAFNGLDLRDLLPPFTGNVPRLAEVPDVLFDGIVSPPWSLEELLCSVDGRPPVLESEPPEGSQTTNSAVPIRLRFRDLPDTEGGVSGVDPDSVRVQISFFSNSGGLCSATLDGNSIESGEDVSASMARSIEPDGSVLLSGELAVAPEQLPARGCSVHVIATAADLAGNDEFLFSSFDVITGGALVELEPAPFSKVMAPFPLSIRLTAPFSDVDLSELRVRISAYSCTSLSLDGENLALDTDVDITSLLNESTGSSPPSRTLSGAVGASGEFCFLNLSVDTFEGEFGLTSDYFYWEVLP